MKSHLDLGNPLPHASISIGSDENAPEEIVVKMNDKEIFTKDLGINLSVAFILWGVWTM